MNLDPQLWTTIGCGLAVFMSASGSGIASASGATYAMKGLDLKSFVPIVIAGVLAIYGLIIGYMLAMKAGDADMTVVEGYKNFGAGLVVGGATYASGWGMSVFVDNMNYNGPYKASSTSTSEGTTDEATTPLLGSVRAGEAPYSKSQFTTMVVSMIYLEAIGLYGLIIALFLTGPMK